MYVDGPLVYQKTELNSLRTPLDRVLTVYTHSVQWHSQCHHKRNCLQYAGVASYNKREYVVHRNCVSGSYAVVVDNSCRISHVPHIYCALGRADRGVLHGLHDVSPGATGLPFEHSRACIRPPHALCGIGVYMVILRASKGVSDDVRF